MNEKLVNKLTWLLISSSLLYLGYILVNYCIADIQQYVFKKEHGSFSKANYMLNLFYAIYTGVSALWVLITLVLFLTKKKHFRLSIVNLYLVYSLFLVMTFIIYEYFFKEYVFYFHNTGEEKLLLFFSYSVIYSIIAIIVSRSKYIAREFIR